MAFVCLRQPGPLGLEQRGHWRVVGAQTSSQVEIGENVLDVKKRKMLKIGIISKRLRSTAAVGYRAI